MTDALGNTTHYTWDRRNNLLSRTDPPSSHAPGEEGPGRTTRLSYDGAGNLIRLERPDGTRWRYQYDPAGRRIAKQRLADDGSVAEETVFTWDGTRLAEQTTSGGRTTSWDYAPGTHRPLTQVDRDLSQSEVDARFHAIVTDLVGTPTELVSPDGRLAWRQRTTAWGAPLPGDGTGGGDVDCPLRFPGQYADAETGWHYNYARYYDPETGRYLSPDPLGLAPSPNNHGYVPNPYLFSDPLGLKGFRDALGRWARDPNAPQTVHNRDTEYPSSYRASTHEEMAIRWTDEGQAQGRYPLDANGNPIPRDQLTWRDPMGRQIPFDQLTYEHREPVVDHWNRVGWNSPREVRNDFYNDVDNLEPMTRSDNSRGGALMTARYRQDTGPNYTARCAGS